MPGKRLINKLLLCLLLLCGLWPATFGWAAEGPVVVLLSDSESAYNRPVVAFSEKVQLPVRLFNLHGDIHHDPQLKNKILQSRPRLILALGAKAAYAAKLWTRRQQDIPVLFAMVLNWQRYQLLDQANMAGIAAEMAPGTQLINMTMVSPDVKRVGIVHGRHSRAIVAQARQAASLLGLELVSQPIDRSHDFRLAFKKMAPEVDAYWVVNDPLVYTLENMDWLEDRCIKERLVCMGQSANIARAGLLMAVNPDPAGIGNQAADLASSILEGRQSPSQIGVMPPLATQILVNRRTGRRIGMELSNQALDMATKVID